MAVARPRAVGGERDHAWDALEKRLECFQLMIVSDMPRAIAEADGSPQNVEKIAATIKSAYERTKKHIQEMRLTTAASVGPQGDQMYAQVRRRHQAIVTQELAVTLGVTADMLQPTLDLSRCLEDVASRADSTYQKAVADYNGTVAAKQAAAAAAAARVTAAAAAGAVATATAASAVPSAPIVIPRVPAMNMMMSAPAPSSAAVAGLNHYHHQQHHQQQQQQHQRQHVQQVHQKQNPQVHHHRLASAAANSVVVSAVANRSAASSSAPRGSGAGKASGSQWNGSWPSAGAGGGTSSGGGGNGSDSGVSGGGGGGITGAGGQGNVGENGSVRGRGSSGAVASRSERPPEEDRHGLLKLPRDNLETVSEQVRSIARLETHLMEERRLRPRPVPPSDQEAFRRGRTGGISAQQHQQQQKQQQRQHQQPQEQPWFSRNVVDHRSAWCGLRDAGTRAGLVGVLRPRPWGDHSNPTAGGREAAASDVLKLLSESTQAYLKQVLTELTTIAWQRRGGLSGDILKGLEARMEDSRLPPPAVELRKGLVPVLPQDGAAGYDPRKFLNREREEHRRECLAREAAWEAEVFESLSKADAERKRVVSRGSSSKADPRARVYAVEAMEASARSGWLSREQLAANEFAKRVGFERGVGLPAAAIAQWKRNGQQGQQPQQQQQQQSRKDDATESDGGIVTGDLRGSAEKSVLTAAATEGEVAAAAAAPAESGPSEAAAAVKQSSQPQQQQEQSKIGEGEGKGAVGSLDYEKDKNDEEEDEDDNARNVVRNVRRRLGGNGSCSALVRDPGKPAGKEINNDDLAEYLRSIRANCSRGNRPLLASLILRLAIQRRQAAEGKNYSHSQNLR